MVDLNVLQEKINARAVCEIALLAAQEQLENAKNALADAENAMLAVEGATPALLASLGVSLSSKPKKKGA